MAADSKPGGVDALVAALDALYAELPDVGCKGLCHAQCVNELIDLSPVESQRIARDTGVRVTSKERGVPCPALDRGRCSVHPVRPMICRLYGAADGMRCEHGCLPSRWLTDQDMMRYLCEAMRIGQHPSFGEREVEFLTELSAHRDIAPLFARYLRGDRDAHLMRRMMDAIDEQRVAAGYEPRR